MRGPGLLWKGEGAEPQNSRLRAGPDNACSAAAAFLADLGLSGQCLAPNPAAASIDSFAQVNYIFRFLKVLRRTVFRSPPGAGGRGQ